jgi:hypothetical protein
VQVTLDEEGAVMRLKTAFLVVTCLVGTTLLTGCSGGPARPETINTTIATTPSMTPTSPSAREEMRQAELAVLNFWTELDQLALDPDRSISHLSKVASGQALARWRELTREMRAAGIHQEGTVVLLSAWARYDAKEDLYRVATCIEVVGVEMTDKDGTSIIPEDREPWMEYTYVVSRVRGALLVTEDSSVGVPC